MGKDRRGLSWNSRGLACAEKRRSVKETIKKAKVELCLRENLGEEKSRVGRKLIQAINMEGEISNT